MAIEAKSVVPTEQAPIPIPVPFMPEYWGSFEFFQHVYHTTYEFGWQVRKRLPGIQGNLFKAQKLLQVVEQLIPNIEEDEREIANRGYSSANCSREIAAVDEAAFCSLYSSLDCFRHVFMSVDHNMGRKPWAKALRLISRNALAYGLARKPWAKALRLISRNALAYGLAENRGLKALRLISRNALAYGSTRLMIDAFS